MREHPIPPATEPLQYRAIGLVRGIYRPEEPGILTRGCLLDSDGIEIEAVVLGRVLSLMRRHLEIDKPHLWVVYPRSRSVEYLHLQISGIQEPSTLSKPDADLISSDISEERSAKTLDELREGDNYFSIRGELIYTKPDNEDVVIKVRQKPKAQGRRPLPFKLQLKGKIEPENLRHFVDLQVRRLGQKLYVEDCKVIAQVPTRGGRRKGGKGSPLKRRQSIYPIIKRKHL